MNLERARKALKRVPAAVEGQGGRRQLMRAAFIGHDWGIPAEQWTPELAPWNAKNQPPWSPRELEREVLSLYRSAQNAFGCKAGGAEPEPVADAPCYPPLAEVREVWRLGVPIDDQAAADGAWRWLVERRKVRAQVLAELDAHARELQRRVPVVRALTTQTALPFDWCRRWPGGLHLLMVPMFDASGAVRSIIARRTASAAMVERRQLPARLKSAAPRGFNVRGLAFMNPLAVEVLRGNVPPPESWWLCEGEMDYLMAASVWPSRAVIGLHAGRLPAELAAWMRSHLQSSRVVVAMDGDEQGKRYEARIARQLRGLRLEVPE